MSPEVFQVTEQRGVGGDIGQGLSLSGQSRPLPQSPQGPPPGLVKVIRGARATGGSAVQVVWRMAGVFSVCTCLPTLPRHVLLSGSHRSKAVCVNTQNPESQAPPKGRSTVQVLPGVLGLGR